MIKNKMIWYCIFVLLFAGVSKAVFAEVEYYTFTKVLNLNPHEQQDTESAGNLKRGGGVSYKSMVSFGYGYFNNPADTYSPEAVLDVSVKPEVIGKPLFYPNPLRWSEGAELGYALSKDMDIEIRMYDMRACEIFREVFFAGGLGGARGYNLLRLDEYTFNGYAISSGVYFFVLIHKGDVLAKGKFVVVP
jgi:hypothetical protein